MGRPPAGGGPAFRFTTNEVSEMETILQEHHNTMPAREVLIALADKFSESPDRKGKIAVQMKQVWNWFQNRRYAVRAKSTKAPVKLNETPVPREDSTPVRTAQQPVQAPISTPNPSTAPVLTPSIPSAGRPTAENSNMEFEAKSARDGAWYDVATFMSHRPLDGGDLEVLVRFAGFGPDEDEWLNVCKNVRQRSLPCEASECVAVLPGDLILCFQEGKDQALYFDAHVLDAQRRRHDVRGCRCRFLVRYDHDQSEEIVPLRKICRRPETDYRLQQLHSANVLASADQQKTSTDSSIANSQKVVNISADGLMQKQQSAVPAVTPVPAQMTNPRSDSIATSNATSSGNPNAPPSSAVLMNRSTINNATSAGNSIAPPSAAALMNRSTEINNATSAGNPNVPPSAAALMNRSTGTNNVTSVGNPNTIPQAAAMFNSSTEISGARSAGNPIAVPNVAATVNNSNLVGTGESLLGRNF